LPSFAATKGIYAPLLPHNRSKQFRRVRNSGLPSCWRPFCLATHYWRHSPSGLQKVRNPPRRHY
jgi:hypothetical protein